MIKEQMHKKIIENHKLIKDWFCDQYQEMGLPIYSSFDIRDAGHKIGVVDANIFPAGFNNICQVDKESSVELFHEFLERHYRAPLKKLLLLTEEHTKNPYYWDNIATIRDLLAATGRDVQVALPKPIEAPLHLESASGQTVQVFGVEVQSDGSILCEGTEPDLIITNNDFSQVYSEWADKVITTPLNPPQQLGWYQRRKGRFFSHYNELAKEFAKLIGEDASHLEVKTETFANFDLGEEVRRQQLAEKIDAFLDGLKSDYQRQGFASEPFAFVKNSAGTYGLGVLQVQQGQDVLSLNYKERKKMKASKGGGGISEVIIQEGIPSSLQVEDGVTAEPAIYLIGCELAGGFLRTHAKKGPHESLNSPGAVYKRLCVSDLKIDAQGSPMENVYGWLARLGLLAIGREAKEMGVVFPGYLA